MEWSHAVLLTGLGPLGKADTRIGIFASACRHPLWAKVAAKGVITYSSWHLREREFSAESPEEREMSSHDASSSAIGYLYQTDWALLELLRGARDRPDQSMTIELFDDVAWEKNGEVQELLQLKHHQQSAGSLSDMSVDLWKTLKVWLDSPPLADTGGPLLTLLTTSASGTNTAASYLGPGNDRDPVLALDLLNAAASNSTSTATSVARSSWLETPHSTRISMVERIRILGGAIRIEDIEACVRTEISWALPIGQEETFLGLFWQWWRRVALDLLQKKRARVNVLEAQQQVQAIRDLFLPDNLPTLVELSQIDEDTLIRSHDTHIFLQQLRWVNVGTTHLRKAVGDYYRAVTQTTEWIDRSLIGLNELRIFEDNLVDEWERAYADMMEDLGEHADDAVRADVGRELWRKLRDSTAVAVRSRYTDTFFARGKRHELADRHLIGWHPDFEDRVRTLLTGRLVDDH